ncbi:MAG: hydroxymethylglutaryl-CoA lyase [Desulfatibacillum sp.]|nr:hydroxymethylglutaryl-CoA lyase [Desulfatibacillum sp.]
MTPTRWEAALPSHVVIREVGPRDGFQAEDVAIPTEHKVKAIEDLAKAGISHIQAVSFVHPKRVPQMQDAEAVLWALQKQPGVTYSGLALNLAGVKRAVATQVDALEISVSASDAHSRKNTGMGRDLAVEQAADMADMAREAGLEVIAGVQCAFGCVFEGAIPEKQVLGMVEAYLALSPQALCIADTTGMAGPLQVQELMTQVLTLSGDLPVFLHLHDTRGLGLVNMTAAIMSGIHHFDTSCGGMGGCPFIPGAAGNVPTEEALYLMERLGIATGVDLSQVSACSRSLEQFLRRVLPGRIHRLN